MNMKIIAPCIAFVIPGVLLAGIFWLGGWDFQRGPAAAELASLSVVCGLAILKAVVDRD